MSKDVRSLNIRVSSRILGTHRLCRPVPSLRGSHWWNLRALKSSFWKPKIGKASTLVLIVGLALELISSSRLSVINRQVVGILSTQAADAGKRAAHAEKATEEERAARVKLKAEVEPERLKGQHQ